MPKNGSLYTPFSTSTANTVFGEEVLYQLEASKLAVETASPPALTFTEDSTAHPSRKVISPSARETGAVIVAAERRAATKLEAAKKPLRSEAMRATCRETKFSFLWYGIMISSPSHEQAGR